MAKIGKMMKGKDKDGAKAGGFEMNQNMMEMMNGFTVIRITNMAATMNLTITKEQLLDFNAKLNKIKKPKKK
jgi:hypothetical protein